MKVIKILFAVFVVTLTSCNSTPDLTEKEIYDVVNQIIADDSIPVMDVCWNFERLKLKPEYKKEFTDNDISFIERQNKLFKDLKIKPNKLKWLKNHSKSFNFATVDTLCDQGIIYHISFPIISADRKKVLIEFREDCNCLLGGQGGKVLYEMKKGHWVRAKEFDHWISQNQKNMLFPGFKNYQ